MNLLYCVIFYWLIFSIQCTFPVEYWNQFWLNKGNDVYNVDDYRLLQICGRSEYHIQHNSRYGNRKRIVGGIESSSHEWPWLVSLLMNGKNHMCGASLVNPLWVVSAAHCFEPIWSNEISSNPKNWTARLGEHNMLKDNEPHLDVEIGQIFIPKERNLNKGLNNDISLLKLKKPVTVNFKKINFVCLPRKMEIIKDRKCVAAGWGHTKEGGEISPVVRHAEISVVDKNKCIEMYKNLSFISLDHQDLFCAMGKNKDACQFDSGGPFICFNPDTNQWELNGIVSTGYGCARKEYPGIYTDVGYFAEWIKNTIFHN